MANETHSAPLGEVRAASTASGGTALTTAAVFVQVPDGTRYAFVTARNFSTAVVARLAFNPYLVVLKTTDNLATATDYSANAQDGSTSTKVTLNSLDTAANTNYLYVGAHIPFRGVAIDVVATNSVASVLTVKYWTGSAWTDITATDGTVSAATSFAQDGNVTWTVPTDWTAASLATIASPVPGATVQYRSTELFWTRWQVSVAFDATTDAASMLAMNRSTAYSEWIANQTIEMGWYKGVGGLGCIEALTDAGTANLLVNVSPATPTGRFP